VGVHGQVVKATIGETVAIILGVLDLCDEAIFGESRDVPVNGASTTLAGKLLDERCGNDFMVLATLLDLFIALACVSRKFVRATKVLETYCSEDAPIVGGKVAQSACVQLHIVEAPSISLRCTADYMVSRREVMVSECM
jgi:hypothetical protein